MAVIPPIVVDKFTCRGHGLLYEGYARESPANLRAMIIRTPISDKDKPKSWWLAQNLVYGLPGNKSSTIGQLRERLQTALQAPNGMVVPEKILNMEVNANKEFNQLNAQVVRKTQPSTSKAKAKATNYPLAPKSWQPKAPAKGKETKRSAPALSKAKATSDKMGPTGTSRTKPFIPAAPISGFPKRVQPPFHIRKPTGSQPPVKQERVKREREEEMAVDMWLEDEELRGPYSEQGPPRKRARHIRVAWTGRETF